MRILLVEDDPGLGEGILTALSRKTTRWIGCGTVPARCTRSRTRASDHRVHGDPARLGILLQNLVGNAIQHTPDGGRIRVRLEARPTEIALFIDDDGPGVPEALKPRLFERFFRAGAGNGAGLGLSIVRRIVELHRGRIVLRDSPLGGLQVEVVLPR